MGLAFQVLASIGYSLAMRQLAKSHLRVSPLSFMAQSSESLLWFGTDWVCAGYALAQDMASAPFASIWGHCSLKVNTLQTFPMGPSKAALKPLWSCFLGFGLHWVCAGNALAKKIAHLQDINIYDFFYPSRIFI